jgi:MFS family permease
VTAADQERVSTPEPPQAVHRHGIAAIPRGIWALGLVSMFMDISSEMIHALLPVFLVTVLGAGATSVGLIEGVAEAAASITKIFSGTLSDYLGKRKLLAVLGYGLAALTKPLFPLAATPDWVFAARFVDRIGKGIRGAPRDALVGEIAPPHLRGASYGLRQSLDTVGAFAGPLIAVGLMALTADDYRTVFWIAVVPAFLAVALLVFGVEEAPRNRPAERPRTPIRARDASGLRGRYWAVVAVSSVFALARFSEAFLVLRAVDVGLAVALVPLVLVAMNVMYALSAYPAGMLSDRMNRWAFLAAGFAVLLVADFVLAASNGIASILVGVALWGLHMGLTQGIFAALVADTTPPELRGTAFGIFNLAAGIAMLLASFLAGVLWDAYGAPATFLLGAAFTMLAGLGAALLYRRGALTED